MKNASYASHGGNYCLVAAGLDVGATPANIESNAAIDYCIDGVIYEKAATAAIVIDGSAMEEQAAETACLYLVSIDAAGTFTVTQGDVVSVPGEDETYYVPWPDLPSGDAPVGAVLVQTNASATFTPGTTSLAAAGVTDTYYDLFAIPTTPVSVVGV